MTTLSFVGEWALRSSIMILAGSLLLWVLRVKSAPVRLAVLVTMLCASLAIPVLTVSLPELPLSAPRPAKLAESVSIALDTAPAVAVLNAAPPPAISSPRFDARRIAVMIYAVVAATLLLRLCVGLALGQRLLRASRPTGQASQGVEIRESERLSVPVTLGIVRPAIVLPADWREWDAAMLQAVLAHERSHVHRMDPLVHALSAIHRALLWHTPLSWFLHRRIVRVAEQASDDAALAVCDRASYAGILLGFMGVATPRVAWQGVSMAQYGRPEDRIRRILEGTTLSRRLTLRSALAIAALVSPVTYVVAAARPQQASGTMAMIAPLTEVASAEQSAAAMRPAALFASAPKARRQTSRPPQNSAKAATQATAATEAATASQPSAGAIQRYVIMRDDHISGSWVSGPALDTNDLRARFGTKFAWFRQNGHDYVVTDAGVMEELDKAMEPQKDVNRKQAEVNGEQARVNAMQSKVNTHQSEVNALQAEVNHRQDIANEVQNAVNRGDNAALIQKLEKELRSLRESKPEASQAGVNRVQSQVNQEQAGVNAEQGKVNAMQQKVNEEQHRVSADFSRRMQEILNSAVQHGAAKQLP